MASSQPRPCMCKLGENHQFRHGLSTCLRTNKTEDSFPQPSLKRQGTEVPRFVRLLGRLRQQEQPTIPPFLGYEGAGSVPPLVQERHQLGGYHGSHPKKREPRACVRCHGFHTSVPWRFKLGWGKLSSVLFVRRHALRPCRNWWFSPSLHTCRDGAARTP